MAILNEQQAVLFRRLRNDTLREIARLRISGYSNGEIAEATGVSLRSVERKLGVIRETWSDELDADAS